ncbi:MAG: hypothetical protein ACKOPQ_13550 [Novosphingobium sp.]
MKRILWALPFCLVASQAAQADDTSAGVIGFLAGGAGSGKTELGEHAGEIEAWAIAANTATKASEEVWKKISVKHPSAKVLILDTSAKFRLTPYWLVRDRTKTLSQNLEAAKRKVGCVMPFYAATESDTNTAPSFANVAGLLRSDKKYDDITIEPSQAFWLNALAGASGNQGSKFQGTAFLLSSLNPNPSAKVSLDWSSLVDQAKLAIAVCGAGAKKSEKKTVLDTVGETISETDTAFKDADKDSQSILEQASQLEPLLSDQAGKTAELLILRTNLEKVGATIVSTKNVLTMFGFPAVTLSGGMIGTFSVEKVDIGRGPNTIVASGNIACTGPKRTLGKWQSGSRVPTTCFINGEKLSPEA